MGKHKLQYEVTTKKYSELADIVVLPKFQRGLVWNKDKKRAFIKTLKEGLPIGILLFAPEGEKFSVIDGLQRYTTMQDYSAHPFNYMEQSEIKDVDIMTIILEDETAKEYYEESDEKNKERIRNEIRDIIVNTLGSDTAYLNDLEKSSKVAERICQNVSIIPDSCKERLVHKIYPIIMDFEGKANIDDVEIPIIIFNGSKTDLATIFQKLNQEGVKLSKYDVFAATWSNAIVTVKDDNFINIITDKYETAQEQSHLEVSDYDPEELRQTGELTVFEYAFALGKAMMKGAPILFPKVDATSNDSLGFIVLNELMGLKYQEMSGLDKAIREHKNISFKELKDTLVAVTQQVEQALEPYICKPIAKYSRKAKSIACHSELQIATYIIVMFKLQYEITDSGINKRQGFSKELKSMKHYLYKHYLYDIIRGQWSGAGDSRIDDITANPDQCVYIGDIDRDTFSATLLEWARAYNEKKKITNVSAECKLCLNYLLRMRVPKLADVDYDVEHCVPKKVIDKYITKGEHEEVPVSSICNMVYIPANENRQKEEWTYYQFQELGTTTYELDQDALNQLDYPSHEELRFVEIPEQITAENYMQFLHSRENGFVNSMIDGLYQGDPQ